MLVKSKEALQYEESFDEQVPDDLRLGIGSLKSPLRLDIVVFYSSNRPDVSVELVMDCLENSGVVKNDRYIKEQHIYGFVDKYNPRVELILTPLSVDRKPPFQISKASRNGNSVDK